MKKVYVDNASTSFPKAPGVSDAMKCYLDKCGVNIGRGGYNDSYDTSLEVLDARQALADLFHVPDPLEIVLTPSVTYSLNMLLQGFLRSGDHVITTSMEHNAVMRPLFALSKLGVEVETIKCGEDGSLAVGDIVPLIKNETKAVVMIHASNVCGTLMPVEAVSEVCRKYGIRLIVDAAQTAGHMDIDANLFDALAFTGHKGLLGPPGIGGFFIKKDFAEVVAPLITGGTGSVSHKHEQPMFLPDRFEAGTLNIPGILGLKKSTEYINSVGVKAIQDKEMALADAFISKVSSLEGVRIVGKKDVTGRVAVVSLDFRKMDNGTVAHELDDKCGIMTRCGLHCAPAAHKTLGTYRQGTVRFSFGYFNTMDDIDYVVRSLQDLFFA